MTGTGSQENCYIISAPPETPWIGVEGQFIDIAAGDNPAGPGGNGHKPTISVQVSGDPGNAVGSGTDGGLFVQTPPAETPWTGHIGPGGIGTITPGGVAGHDPTFTLTCADINACVPAAPAETPNTGISTSTAIVSATGLYGRNIQVDVTPGCGLAATGNGLRVNTSGTWSFPCADTNGAPIYCDANGQLRTNPEKSCVRTARLGAFDNTGVIGAGGSQAGACIVATVNNPSSCLPMIVNYIDTTSMEIVGDFATSVRFALSVGSNNFGAVGPGDYAYLGINPQVVRQIGAPGPFLANGSNNDIGTIGPGGTAQIQSCGKIFVDAGGVPNALIQHTVILDGCNT